MLPHAVALSLYAFCHCPRVAVMELHQDLQCPSAVHSWLPSLLLLPALYTDNRSAWSTAQTIPLLSAKYSPNAQATRHPSGPIFYDTWLHTLCATETEEDLVGPSWVKCPLQIQLFGRGLFYLLPQNWLHFICHGPDWVQPAKLPCSNSWLCHGHIPLRVQ